MPAHTIDQSLLRGAWIIAASQSTLLCNTSQGLGTQAAFDANAKLIVEPVSADSAVDESASAACVAHIRCGALYFSLADSAFGTTEDPSQAAAFTLEGDTSAFTLAVAASSGETFYLEVVSGEVSLGAYASNATAFSLVCRVPYVDTTEEESPFSSLLPGELAVYDEPGYTGRVAVFVGEVDQISLVVGPDALGDGALAEIASWRVGPATMAQLLPGPDGNNSWQPCSDADTVDIDQTIVSLSTQVGIRTPLAGAWVWLSPAGTVIGTDENGNVVDTGQEPAIGPDAPPAVCITPIDDATARRLGGDRSVPLANNAPLYGLSSDGNSWSAEAGGTMRATSGTWGPWYLLVDEGTGQFSVRAAATGQWLAIEGDAITTTDASDRRAIFTRLLRPIMVGYPMTPGNIYSPYISVAGPLNPGDVVLYPSPYFGSFGAATNHDIDGLDTLWTYSQGVGSIQVGPDTSVDLLDVNGTVLRTLTASRADTSDYGGQVVAARITRRTAARSDEIRVSSKLIDDIVVGADSPVTVWRSSIVVTNQDGLPQPDVSVNMSVDDGAEGTVSAWCNGTAIDLGTDSVAVKTNRSGEIVLCLPADALTAPVVRLQTAMMADDVWVEICPDQDLHEKLSALDGGTLVDGFPATQAQPAKPSPFAGLTSDTADEIADAIAASAGLIRYDDGDASLGGPAPAAAPSALELMHWRTCAARRSRTTGRRVSGANARHQHFVVELDGAPGRRFAAHPSGWAAMADFHDRVRASAHGPITYVHPSSLSWLGDLWDKAERWVVSTVEDAVESAAEVIDQVADAVMVTVHYIEDAIDKVVTVVLNAVEQVAQMINAAFHKLESAVDEVVAFFSFVFDWDSVLALQQRLLTTVQDGVDTLDAVIADAGAGIEAQIIALTKEVSDALTTYATQLGGETGDQLPGGSTTQTQENPADDNWMMSKVNDTSDSGGTATPVPADLLGALEQFVTDVGDFEVDGSGLTEAMATLTAVIDGQLDGLTGARQILAAVVQALAGLVQYCGQLAADVVDIVVQLLRTLLQTVVSLLQTPISNGRLADFFSSITGGQALSPWNVVGLALAIPVAIFSDVEPSRAHQRARPADASFDVRAVRIVLASGYALSMIVQPIFDGMAIANLDASSSTSTSASASAPALFALANTLVSVSMRISVLSQVQPRMRLEMARITTSLLGAVVLTLMSKAELEATGLPQATASVVGCIRLVLAVALAIDAGVDGDGAGLAASSADCFGSVPQALTALRAPGPSPGVRGAILITADIACNLVAAGLMAGAVTLT